VLRSPFRGGGHRHRDVRRAPSDQHLELLRRAEGLRRGDRGGPKARVRKAPERDLGAARRVEALTGGRGSLGTTDRAKTETAFFDIRGTSVPLPEEP